MTGTAVSAARQAAYDASMLQHGGCASVDDWKAAVSGQTAIADWKLDIDQVEASRECYDLVGADPTNQTLTVIGLAWPTFQCSPADADAQGGC